MRAFRALYGSSPLHLLAVVACLVVALVAAVELYEGPSVVRIGLWFLGAVLLHDLVLYPAYLLLDTGATRVLGRRAINYARVPALLSGLLLLMFWPVITQHSEGSFSFASGLDQDAYLGRYLAIVAVLFGVSGVLWLVRGRRA